MNADDRYDAILLGILQNERKIDRFLDVMFSFLCRRTDFYHILTKEKQSMGFPPGAAKKMTLKAFEIYEAIHREQYNAIANVPPPVAQTVEVATENPPLADSKEPVQSEQKEKKGDSPATQDDSYDKAYQAPADSYNGADRGNYNWSQTITDLDLRVRVPPHVKKAKDVKVKISRKRVLVQVTEESSNETFKTILDDAFPWEVNTEESMWSLLPKDEHVHISLEKARERWWDKALESETDAIDVRKIDCSRPITELDDESQEKVQQLMYDQRQKALGLPTSEEQKMTQLLSKAWNAEGSPFQGQPFDPSRVHIGSDGSATVD